MLEFTLKPVKSKLHSLYVMFKEIKISCLYHQFHTAYYAQKVMD